MLTGLLGVAVCLAVAQAYPSFQDAIPNGELVPHPCKPNYLWKGVGHFNVLGGGARNPFGRDFAKLGKTWSEELCWMDSDGDGKTNGVELGDPNCVWSRQGGAPNGTATGHPGVCEPIDSANCKAKNAAQKDDWEFCEQGVEFECDGLDEPDVEQMKIALDPTEVPAKETTYMCQLVKLPEEEQYHIIGHEPAIDNKVVTHHIVLYGCDELAAEKLEDYNTAKECDSMRVYENCKYSVGIWAVGMTGTCYPPDVGTRFGKRTFNHIMIEVHYNNPMETPNYIDGSGLTIYYTPELRDYDAGSMTVGQLVVAVPPGADTHYQTGYCTSKCTEDIDDNVYIYNARLHMHYLGRGGRVEHWRNGKMVNVLIDEDTYSYDDPKEYLFDPPVVFMPGDELKTLCKFKSTSRSEMTYYGEATSDEMCFAFIGYYPLNKYFSSCTNYGPLNMCETKEQDTETLLFASLLKMGCDIGKAYDPEKGLLSQMFQNASILCGLEKPKCTPECKEYLEETYITEPCLQDGMRYMFDQFMMTFPDAGTEGRIKMLRICDKQITRANTYVNYMDEREYQYATAGSSALSVSMVAFAAVQMVSYITKNK